MSYSVAQHPAVITKKIIFDYIKFHVWGIGLVWIGWHFFCVFKFFIIIHIFLRFFILGETVKVFNFFMGVVTVIRRLRRLPTNQTLVRSGARETIHIEDGEKVSDNLSFKVNGSLNAAVVNTLDGLFDAANCSHIVAHQRHSCHSDVAKRNPHLVD